MIIKKVGDSPQVTSHAFKDDVYNQFVEKKVNESEGKTPENVRKQHSQDCSTGIRNQNVQEIASQNSAEASARHEARHGDFETYNWRRTHFFRLLPNW